MVELIIFRHPETMADMPYVRHGMHWVPYAQGRQLLKGQADDILYRLNHRGILDAYQTAVRIAAFYEHALKNNPQAKVDLWRNELIRSSEGEAITRYVLNSTFPDASINEFTSDDLCERNFGLIEGRPVSDLEMALKSAQDLGRIPRQFVLDDALCYCDDFQAIEETLGLKGDKKSESFQATLERSVSIMKYILTESQFATYGHIFVHKIFASFLIGAADILERRRGNTKGIHTLSHKRNWVRPYYLSPSRFARIPIRKLEDGHYWIERYSEINDGRHLSEVPEMLTRADIQRANEIRGLISDWYGTRGIPVFVNADSIPPYYMHGGDDQGKIEVMSPIELPAMLRDTNMISAEHVKFHFITQVEKQDFDLARWVGDCLGDKNLAAIITRKCKHFSAATPIVHIRRTLSEAIDNYYSH